MLMIEYIKFVFVWQYVFHVSDIGITALFTLIAWFVMMLCHTVKLKALEEFASQLPKTVYVAQKILGKDKDLFTKFACSFSKKRLDWQKFTILLNVHSWLCKKTRHLSRVQYGCKAAVSFLTNINVKFGLIVLLNSNSNGISYILLTLILSQFAFCKTTYIWSSDWHRLGYDC